MAKKPIDVATLTHEAASRKNIPTAEFESVMREEEKSPVQVAYERRNRDLDPQLVWRGKDEQDWSDLIVQAPPLYIQEKVHPKVIIDDLKRESRERAEEAAPAAPDLFADFNGLKDKEAATEFYQHDQHWSNRMISGDSLSVMASLAEREGLRGKVQCIYFDPPYGIKFNSNFQWSTTSNKVTDGAKDQLTREPEQVRAFRDTWRDGIHSYLTYLRDRLVVARDLIHESGSIFVQIGDENVHRVRAVMDEVFGDENEVSIITLKKTAGQDERLLNNVSDFILWYAKDKVSIKFRENLNVRSKNIQELGQYTRIDLGNGRRRGMVREDFSSKGDLTASGKPFRLVIATSSGHGGNVAYPISYEGKTYLPTANRHWSTHTNGFNRLIASDRIAVSGATLAYVRFFDDFIAQSTNNVWSDLGSATDKKYVVETAPAVVQRCILMTTDPGDLVLDPTCGSGTTAYVAEQWGRRWITIDTSRVAIALARSRLMGARYAYYLLADSTEGQRKESEVTRTAPRTTPTRGDIRHGFVYERVPHITLKSIANNAEIDVIRERSQAVLEPLRAALNQALGKTWKEWEIPREGAENWPVAAKSAHEAWWAARIARQREIDASIAAKAEFEFLYDKPYPDNSRIRVAGPFTVESLSPHRTLAVDWNDELLDVMDASAGQRLGVDRGEAAQDFAQMILENLRAAGVQQAHKEDRIQFIGLTGWPGRFICAEGIFMEGEVRRRAGIFIGPEFGTVSRPDLVAAAREAGDAGFDVLIACAFSYDAHSAEFAKLGRVTVLKARMNPDLHMATDLKATGAGNLFVVFGEPDIQIEDAGEDMIRVRVFGVDVFKPQTGEVISEGTDGIALWMLDTDYNEESFFVRHAYFLGANDPYKALKTTLKSEIDEEGWESLHREVSRPFTKPKSGRIAVKVINHLGDEVMKVFAVE
ncbi:MAG: site-specific DNA-methyltransferase [Rhodospirillales bacterium 20-64-7]|nr:MAG: site-specific DNA-methyltransferase [Rhodospirillales bacterium 20-64-7]